MYIYVELYVHRHSLIDSILLRHPLYMHLFCAEVRCQSIGILHIYKICAYLCLDTYIYISMDMCIIGTSRFGPKVLFLT